MEVAAATRAKRPLHLTRREREYIVRVCRCPEPTRAELAEQMQCTEKTVEAHRANVYRKLKVHSRTELVLTAIQLGLVPCGCPANKAALQATPTDEQEDTH
ncbi:MAG: response regulator transcription factor [Flavobacteriales bacterium]|nr:response regulator transcription factor [Flavobacteriales bacterium]